MYHEQGVVVLNQPLQHQDYGSTVLKVQGTSIFLSRLLLLQDVGAKDCSQV